MIRIQEGVYSPRHFELGSSVSITLCSLNVERLGRYRWNAAVMVDRDLAGFLKDEYGMRNDILQAVRNISQS
jgi:hypothetical protein